MSFYLNGPGEEKQLQREAEQFANQRGHSSEIERQDAMNAISAEQEVDNTEAEFATFREEQNVRRAWKKFLADYPQYRNVAANTAALEKFISEQFNGAFNTETLDVAFATLSASGKLLLDVSKTPRTWDPAIAEPVAEPTPEETYAQYQKEEAEDRALFEKGSTDSGEASSIFLARHPRFIVCQENGSAVVEYFAARNIDTRTVSVAQLNNAYNDLVAEGRLKLRAAPVESGPSRAELEQMSLTELEQLRDRGPADYVPDPDVRYKIGSQF
jgi:hypothetical protein